MADITKGEISVDDDPKMTDLKLKMISRQEDVQVVFALYFLAVIASLCGIMSVCLSVYLFSFTEGQ